MRAVWCVLGVVGAVGCGGHYTASERQADREVAIGDTEAANRDYAEAMSQRPLMDYDYERLRKKREKAMKPVWQQRSATVDAAAGPAYPRILKLLDERTRARAETAPQATLDQLDKAIITAAHDLKTVPPVGDALAQLQSLVQLRHDARTQVAPITAITAIDEAIATTANGAAIAQGAAPGLDGITSLITTTLSSFVSLSAPQPALDAVMLAITTRESAGIAAPTSSEAEARIQTLLDLRTQIRIAPYPLAIDHGLDPMFDQLGAVTPPPAPTDAAGAQAAFTAATELRTTAAKLGAGSGTLAYLAKAQELAVQPLLANADELAAAHHYVAALALLQPAIIHLDATAPARARYDAMAQQAVLFHSVEASKYTGYQQLLQHAMAAAFGGTPTARDADEKALAPQYTTTLAIKPVIIGACPAAKQFVVGTRQGKAARVEVAFTSCDVGVTDSTEARQWPYDSQESVLTGHHTEQTNPHQVPDGGTHMEDCTASHGIAGEVIATCEVPNTGTHLEYDTVEVDDYTTQEKSGAQAYEVALRTFHAQITATATYRADDGTVLTLPLAIDHSETAEAYDFTYPGRLLADAPRRETKVLPGSFTVEHFQGSQLGELDTALAAGITRLLREHKAAVARADGAAALAKGDANAAGEAFVKSVLLEGTEPTAEAATWFQQTHALTPAQVMTAIRHGSYSAVTLAAFPAADTFAGPALVSTADLPGGDLSNGSDLEIDTHGVTTESYHSGIQGGVDVGNFFAGLMPFKLPNAADGVTSMSIGVQTSWAILAHATRYGPAIADEATFRLGWGARFGDHEYSDGSEDGKIAYGVDLSYRLMAGLRFHDVGLYAGAGVGWMKIVVGDTKAHGSHIEPTAELTFRAVGVQNVHLQVSGFAYRYKDWSRRDRVTLQVPVSQNHRYLSVAGTYEQTDVDVDTKMEDGTSVDLGKRKAKVYLVQVGMLF